MSNPLTAHQQKLIVHKGSPKARPAITPGAQFDEPVAPEEDPWWMFMGPDGLKSAESAATFVGALNMRLGTRGESAES